MASKKDCIKMCSYIPHIKMTSALQTGQRLYTTAEAQSDPSGHFIVSEPQNINDFKYFITSLVLCLLSSGGCCLAVSVMVYQLQHGDMRAYMQFSL